MRGIPVRYDTVNMLGSTIGLGTERTAHCLDAVGKQHAGTNRHHPTSRRWVFHVSYLCRVTPHSIIREAAERFDERVLHAAITKSGLPPPSVHPDTDLILTLPHRLDGLGFRPHTRASPCAYWASLALSAPSLLTWAAADMKCCYPLDSHLPSPVLIARQA